MKFPLRSYQPELLDSNTIPFADIQKNMQELDIINRRLGGHAISMEGLRKLVAAAGSLPPVLHICEIGCGGGDNLRALSAWCKRAGITAKFTGIDSNPHCVQFAAAQNPGFHFICSDYRDAVLMQAPDIIFSSLFCHHFTDDALVTQLQWMEKHCTVGFFINDLHRHPFAYYSIKWLTAMFSGSYLVKNDAPLSVQRGFVRKEWESLIAAAGLPVTALHWRWAFRWLLVYRKASTDA